LHRRTFYKVRDRDERFAQAWDEAFELGTEMLEDELRRRALDGWHEDTFDGDGKLTRRVHRFSSNDLLTMLKARRPELYRENARVELAGSVQTTSTIRHENGLTVGDVLRFARSLGDDAHLGVLQGLMSAMERNGHLNEAALTELNEMCRRLDAEAHPTMALEPGDAA
jgi:hypothetical protein